MFGKVIKTSKFASDIIAAHAIAGGDSTEPATEDAELAEETANVEDGSKDNGAEVAAADAPPETANLTEDDLFELQFATPADRIAALPDQEARESTTFVFVDDCDTTNKKNAQLEQLLARQGVHVEIEWQVSFHSPTFLLLVLKFCLCD